MRGRSNKQNCNENSKIFGWRRRRRKSVVAEFRLRVSGLTAWPEIESSEE
jgi:hypothetical protein